MTQKHEGRALAGCATNLIHCDARLGVAVDPAKSEAALGRDTFEQESIGRKVVTVGDDFGALRVAGELGVNGCPSKLVQNHTGGVSDERLPGRGAQSGATNLVAEFERKAHPFFVPRANQARAPLLTQKRFDAVNRSQGRPPERIAVEVGEWHSWSFGVGFVPGATRSEETIAVRAQFVRCVETGSYGSKVSHRKKPIRSSEWGGCE